MRIPGGPEHQSAFEQLEAQITSPDILGLSVFEQPFTLDANASKIGAGAALSQVLQDVEHVIAFASHDFSPVGSLRGATERECVTIL